MGFRFRKIYADLVTADGTVCITYLAWVEAWGMRSAFGGVELYTPDGRRRVVRALPPPPQPPPAGDAGPVELRLRFHARSLCLRYEPFHPPWTPDDDAPGGQLQWSVRVPRGMATARWSGDGALPDLTGSGYVDWVEIARPTRWLAIRTLQWGRVHLPGTTLVFTGIESRTGEGWRRVAQWTVPGSEPPRVRSDLRLVRQGEAVAMEIGEPEGSEGCGVLLRPERVLHSGSAVDPARSPGRLERLAFRLVTGPSSETRWISRAHPLNAPSPEAQGGFAVHEAVRFGR